MSFVGTFVFATLLAAAATFGAAWALTRSERRAHDVRAFLKAAALHAPLVQKGEKRIFHIEPFTYMVHKRRGQIAITIEGALSAEYSLQLPEGVGSLKDCDRLEVSLPEPLRAYLRDKNTLRAFERLLATGHLQSIEAESGRLSALFNKRTIAAEGLALRLQRLSEFGALLKNIPHTPELAKSPSGAPLGLRS